MRAKPSGKFLAEHQPFLVRQMRVEQKNRLRANLVELVQACPYDHCNPEDCPLFGLRQASEADRLVWFKALSEADLVYLATYHYTCLATKSGLRPAKSTIKPANRRCASGNKTRFSRNI